MPAEIEDSPGRDATFHHRRGREHEREDEQAFVAEAGERAPHRRMIEALGLRKARAARHDAGHHADDRHAEPHHAPRSTEPQRHAGHGRAGDASAVEQAVKADEPARVVRERVRGDDVHDHVDEAARGHGHHERENEQHQMGCPRLESEERAPNHERPRQ